MFGFLCTLVYYRRSDYNKLDKNILRWAYTGCPMDVQTRMSQQQLDTVYILDVQPINPPCLNVPVYIRFTYMNVRTNFGRQMDIRCYMGKKERIDLRYYNVFSLCHRTFWFCIWIWVYSDKTYVMSQRTNQSITWSIAYLNLTLPRFAVD